MTVLLSALATFSLGGVMSYTLADGLYESRLETALEDTSTAVNTVNRTLAGAAVSDETTLQTLLNSLVPTLEEAGSRKVALLRSPGQPQLQLLQSPVSADLDFELIPDDLREAVRDGGNQLSYKPIELVEDDSAIPGLIVGAPVDVPLAGQFELYLVFDLQASQLTLNYVQQVVTIGGVILLVIIAFVSFFVTRRVVKPVLKAAEVSEEFAKGDLDRRMSEKGEDAVSTLARSLNRMARNLQQQIDQLDQLSKMQQRFVSDVSHELRTPMTTIKLAGEVIFARREDLDPSLKRSAELLHDQISRFEQLLADLLEISRYDAKSVTPDIEKADLNGVVGRAIASIEPLAQSKQVDIQIDLPNGPVEVEIDPKRIERLLRNLLANAAEHGQGKPIKIAAASDGHASAVTVSDGGDGMDQEQLEHVFDRFWRADPARQRSVGGTGLGLAISMEDARLHNGWLEVWSEKGVGTTFRLTLPVKSGYRLTDSPLPLEPTEELA